MMYSVGLILKKEELPAHKHFLDYCVQFNADTGEITKETRPIRCFGDVVEGDANVTAR